MNNFEEYEQIKNDDKNINDMGELNTEALSTVDNEISSKLSKKDLLTGSVKNTRDINEVLDREDAYESHFSPYENLFSDPIFDFE